MLIKLSQYLSHYTPLFCHAPPEAAQKTPQLKPNPEVILIIIFSVVKYAETQ